MSQTTNVITNAVNAAGDFSQCASVRFYIYIFVHICLFFFYVYFCYVLFLVLFMLSLCFVSHDLFCVDLVMDAIYI